MPKEPLPVPRAVRLRERAAILEAKAEELLREAKDLLISAEEIEAYGREAVCRSAATQE
jgi:hypothetical protein